MPFPLAAAIPAAASLIGTGFNAISGGKMNKKNREFTAEQNAINREQTWEMWEATNDFNIKTSDPGWQMQRYKDAGLNPHLIYGQPQKIDASPMQTNNAPPPPGSAPKIDLKEAVESFFQRQMQEKQLQVLDSEIKNKDAATQNTQTATANLQQDMDYKAKLFPGQAEAQGLDNLGKGYTNQNLQATNEKIFKEIESIGANINVSNQQVVNMKQQVAESMVKINNLIKEGQYLDAKKQTEELGIRLLKNTVDNKIERDKLETDFLRSTQGMGNKSWQNVPMTLIGALLRGVDVTTEAVKRKIKKSAY